MPDSIIDGAQKTAPNFVHLHVHTEYSLLDGSSKIKEIVHHAKELGMEHLAITDHGVMYGAMEFYKACKAEGVHPIIGCEVYVTKNRLAKEGRSDAEYNHLVLLAESELGYRNLIALVSRGFTEGYYYKPRIDWELLEQYHEGLIALSACLAGVVARPILNETYDAAKAVAEKYAALFGPEHFYLELQNHGMPEQAVVNSALLRMAKELSLPLVVTNDVHYTYKEDKQAHDILLCIQTGKKVQDQDRLRYEGDYYLKSPEEMAALFPQVPEAVENTVKIAERCKLDFVFHELKLPRYDVPAPYTAPEYLRLLCEKGLEERYPNADESIRARLDYELGVIGSMGYVDYFLIVWDFINFARSRGIMVGPGRGSAAGSIVSYCLHITNIDPLRYELIFERFLNPERVSMPDIDIDFCYRRRQEVIDYVTEKYGKDQVAQIVTFGTMKARLVIRDVGRAIDYPYADTDKIAKLIPNELGMTIDKALEISKELKNAYDADDKVHELIDMSKRLEGLPRHCSTHAAGVLISNCPTTTYVPLMTNEGAVSTQYTMTILEELGLLKMDFLGLRTLTVIQDTLEFIRSTEGREINLDTLSMDDPEVFKMIGAGKTDAVFQLESPGMTAFMRELKPESIEDVIAGISLYRPGPMDFIPNYIKGKKNPGSIQYKTPLLKPILEKTYGCIVYQEQVMQIVRDLAGYTLGRSDLVRRAMSKKKADVMAKERANFVYGNAAEGVPGCAANGIAPDVAEAIFDEMTDFAKYAFNKSHAAAYAVVAYQTAYLKYYYPVEFMAAMLSSVIDDSKKVIHYIGSLRSMGIELMAPDINEGCDGFSVSVTTNEKGERVKKIRYALSSVKNVGHSCIEKMERERELNGPFTGMMDFCRRMQDKDLNKRAVENLIKAGAFDSLGGERSQYMGLYPLAMSAANNWKNAVLTGQMDIFGMGGGEDDGPSPADDDLPRTPAYPEALRLAFEKEALGLYLSGHPLSESEELWRKYITNYTSDFQKADEDADSDGKGAEENEALQDGTMATIGGIITKKSVKTTKTNMQMAVVTLEDLYGTVDVLVFPNQYEQYHEYLQEDAKIFVYGQVNNKEDEDSKLICRSLAPFEKPEMLDEGKRFRPKRLNPEGEKTRCLWLQVTSMKVWENIKDQIRTILEEDKGSQNEGPYEIKIYFKEERRKFSFGNEIRTWAKPATVARLGKILGEDSVKVTES